MKCLMKYQWVKLPRNHLPEGKGIMSAWAKLASRAAFRKGQASYCGHINAVSPGMWSGGVVGLKSILGSRSRAQSLETLSKLSELGYGEDSEVRGATLYNICFAYWKVGEFDKALEQARKLPNLYKARENALVYFLKGEERHKIAKEALVPIAWVIAHHLTALYETENDPAYLCKASQILDILFSGDKEDDFIKSIRERISL